LINFNHILVSKPLNSRKVMDGVGLNCRTA
jgi:hypothetical protein